MSGICGIHDLFLRPLNSRDLIDQMSAQLRHRGPDSQGKIERPYMALAIRLLRIVDTQTGDQPLSNETGEISLVFDGEIYNHRELRKALLDSGHLFKTLSDGEVMVHLYEEKGTDFVRDLNGRFAVALWDDRERRLVLARDRAGEKPLYYWFNEETLLFGSEIKSILACPSVSRRLDPDAVAQYFFYGYVPTPQTIYADIKKLPGAHLMVVEGQRSRIECYWKLQDYPRAAGDSRMSLKEEEGACDELREKLREAARSRFVSNVPLGVFLSSSIESSTVLAIMSELSPGNANCFSIRFPERSVAEEESISNIVKHFNFQHHVLAAEGQSIRGALVDLANDLDEPVADPSIVSAYLLSRFTREHTKVTFSCEGGEELFGRYPTYLGARAAEYYLKVPKVLRRQVIDRVRELLSVSSALGPKGQLLCRYLSYAEEEPGVRHHAWFGMFSPEELDQLFAPQWTKMHPLIGPIFSPLSRVLERARFDDGLTEMFYLDFRMHLENNLLVKLDRTSAACSLEMRTPFLDHRLIEFVAGLPTNLKVRGLKGMYILRKAIEKWLPRKAVPGQGRGSILPIAGWIRNEFRPLVAEALEKEKVKRQGVFNTAYVGQLLQEHSTGRADHRKALWTLLSFQLWYDRWEARG